MPTKNAHGVKCVEAAKTRADRNAEGAFMNLVLPRSLWMAFVISIALFTYVLHTFGSITEPNVTPEILQQRNIFLGIALTELTMVYILPRVAQKNIRKTSASRNPLLPIFIARMAVTESVSLLGFILAIQAHEPSLAYPFFGATLFVYLFLFPTEERFQKLAEMLRGDTA
jgi:uncharacterized membrane protein YesL